MNNQQSKRSIKDIIFGQIKSGEVKMRSKAYFISKTVLIALATIFSALFALYLVSFIVFVLRASGLWFLPGFGFAGLRVFLVSSPWLLILVAILLIAALEFFAKHFSFVYRRPLLYSILAVSVLVIIGSIVVHRAQIHPGLFLRAKEGRLPVMDRLYQGYGPSAFGGVHPGIISEMADDKFTLHKSDGRDFDVLVSPETRFIPTRDAFQKNDEVVVMGKEEKGMIRARGVRKMDGRFDLRPRNGLRLDPIMK